MTDKQIIIYKKECYNEPHCSLNQVLEQLKAKEQECEELKEQLKEMNEVIRTETTRCNLVNILKTELDQLKAENDELKKTVDDLLHKPKIQDKILWKIDNEALLGSKDAYIYKLEKTLTEIKELCQKHIKAEKIVMANDILQKISECEENDE